MTLSKHTILLLVALAALPPLMGQTFQIISRTPGAGTPILTLDASSTITYNVTASGLSGTVVPTLVPHNPGDIGKVVATWTGTAPTSTLTNLSFKVHLYNDGTFCAQSIPFDLIFYSTSFSGGITATSSNPDFLDIDVRGSETTLSNLLSATPALPVVLTSSSDRTYFLSFNVLPSSELLDPANRIYFWADYNLAGFSWGQQFSVFDYGLGQSNCAIDGPLDINAGLQVTGLLVDRTGPSPVVVNQAPYGGGGTTPTLGTGINVFDVTDVDPILSGCGSTVRTSVQYGNGPVTLTWRYVGFGVIVRKFALYLGQPSCAALTTNFGAPPSSTFRIDNFYLSSAGEVSADLVVPNAWGTASQLNSNFRVQWFLRKNGKLISLGAETRGLALDAISSETITDPQNYYLEARVRRTDTNATVSLTNIGAHNRTYTLSSATFTHAEPEAADAYLDPGETLTFNWQIDHASGSSLPSLSYASGIVVDANGNGVLEPATDTYLANNTQNPSGLNIRTLSVTSSGSGSRRNALAGFSLLTLDNHDAVWFYVDVTGSNGTTVTTYRRYLSLRQILGGSRDLNAENTNLFYDYDFRVSNHTNEGWSVSNDVSSAGSRGWSYSSAQAPGPWVGQGGTTVQNAADIYRLITPALPIGKGTTVSFEHQPQFTQNLSGGLIEYRTRSAGSAWPNAWTNLITNFCNSCGFYDGVFSNSLESYLVGRQVWMSNHATPQQVDVPIPDSLESGFPNNTGEIQMRFLFADTAPPTALAHWEVNHFNYETNQLLDDNYFGIDLSTFPLPTCGDPSLTLTPWAPYPVSQLTFVWYQDLNALWAQNGTPPRTGALGAVVPFVQSVSGLYTYFVKISHADTERILPVTVNQTPGISQSQAIQQILEDAPVNWPLSQNILTYVGIVNTVCNQ